jgi:hypothetical protein
MSIIKKASRMAGLMNNVVIDEFFGKVETPSRHELERSQESHRQKEMNDLFKKTFLDYADKVEEYEKEFLRVLKLPDIDIVREAFLGEKFPSTPKKFEMTPAMEKEIRKLFGEWKAELLDVEDAIYPSSMKGGYAVGAKASKKEILKLIEKHGEVIFFRDVLPNLNNPYLKSLVTNGGVRITAKLGKEYMPEVIKALREMALEGLYPIEVGRRLHGLAGEGQLWYWNRIARSECVLSAGAAYDDLCEQNGIEYDEWSAASNACEVCDALDGHIWEHGWGPVPVADTHPHCCCVRQPILIADKPVQDRWNRENSPYDVPYSAEEIEKMNRLFDAR